MKPIRLLFLVLVILVALSCGLTKGSIFKRAAESDQALSTGEETQEEKKPLSETEGLRIESSPSAAMVYINKRFIGETPLTIKDMDEGSYKLELKKKGYYDYTTWIQYSGEDQSYYFTLERIMGQIEVSVQPLDAVITLDNETIDQGINRVPVGTYHLIIRSFGYEPYEQGVIIRENETTRVNLTLQVATFRIYDIELTKRAFNPDNPGALGSTTLKFKVSTYGTGIVHILGSDGHELLRNSLPRFKSWSQTFVWDGRSGSGEIQEDGSYTIKLEARADGNDIPIIMHEETVTVDHSMTITYRSLWSGNSGLLYSSTTDVLPPHSFQIASTLMGHTESIEGKGAFRAPLGLSFRIGLVHQMEIDVHAGIILENVEAVPLLGSGAFKYRFISLGESLGFDGAVTAKISYQANTGTDTFSDFTGLSVGVPSQLGLGPVALVLNPELILSPYVVTYDSTYDNEPKANLWLYLRGGLLLDLRTFMAGLSISARTIPFSRGFALDVPFQTGLEAHLMIPGTQLFLSFALASEIESSSDWYVMGGGGLGFLY